MRAANPENCSQNDDYGGDRENSPGNFSAGTSREIRPGRAHVFGPRKLQVGKFLHLESGLRFHRGFDGLVETLFGSAAPALRRTHKRWTFGLPNFMGVDLGLAKASQIVSDRFLRVHS